MYLMKRYICILYMYLYQASSDQHEMTVELDVFLCNGKSKKVNCSSYDRTSHVLEVNQLEVAITSVIIYTTIIVFSFVFCYYKVLQYLSYYYSHIYSQLAKALGSQTT